MSKIGTSEHHKLLDLLKKYRVDAGLRQVDLGRKLGITQSQVSKFEVGERRLDVLELRDVCLALGISLLDFVIDLEKSLSEDNETKQ